MIVKKCTFLNSVYQVNTKLIRFDNSGKIAGGGIFIFNWTSVFTAMVFAVSVKTIKYFQTYIHVPSLILDLLHL